MYINNYLVREFGVLVRFSLPQLSSGPLGAITETVYLRHCCSELNRQTTGAIKSSINPSWINPIRRLPREIQ